MADTFTEYSPSRVSVFLDNEAEGARRRADHARTVALLHVRNADHIDYVKGELKDQTDEEVVEQGRLAQLRLDARGARRDQSG